MLFLFTRLSLTCCLSYFVIFCDILSWNSDLDLIWHRGEELLTQSGHGNRATEQQKRKEKDQVKAGWFLDDDDMMMVRWYGWWHDMDMGIIWYKWYDMDMGMDVWMLDVMLDIISYRDFFRFLGKCQECQSKPTELRPWAAFAMTCWLAAFRAKCGLTRNETGFYRWKLKIAGSEMMWKLWNHLANDVKFAYFFHIFSSDFHIFLLKNFSVAASSLSGCFQSCRTCSCSCRCCWFGVGGVYS